MYYFFQEKCLKDLFILTATFKINETLLRKSGPGETKATQKNIKSKKKKMTSFQLFIQLHTSLHNVDTRLEFSNEAPTNFKSNKYSRLDRLRLQSSGYAQSRPLCLKILLLLLKVRWPSLC